MLTIMDWLTIAALIDYERKAKIRRNREALIIAQAAGMYTPNELRAIFNDPPHTRVITEVDEPTLRLVTENSAYSQYLKRCVRLEWR